MDLGTFTILKNYSLSPSPPSTTLALYKNSDGTYSTTGPYSTGVAAALHNADIPITHKQSIKSNISSTYSGNTKTGKNEENSNSLIKKKSSPQNTTFSRKSFPKESSFLYTNTVKNPHEHYATTTSRMTPKNPGVVSASFAGTKNVSSGVENAQRNVKKGGIQGPKSVLKIVGDETSSSSKQNGSEQIVKNGFVRNDVVGLINVYETNNNNTRLCADRRDKENGNLIKSVIALTNNGKSYRIDMNNEKNYTTTNYSNSNNNNNNNNNSNNIDFITDDRNVEDKINTLFYYHTATVYALAVEKNIPQYTERSSNTERTFFATGGDDKWLNIWCSKKRELIVRVRTDKPIKCLDFDSNNNYLLVGYNNGSFSIYRFIKNETRNRLLIARNNRNENDIIYSLLSVCDNIKKLNEEISDAKFSPNNEMIAVGSHDDVIDM